MLIIDPPRAGCTEEFLDQLLVFQPARVVYVSCDPATQVSIGILCVCNLNKPWLEPHEPPHVLRRLIIHVFMSSLFSRLASSKRRLPFICFCMRQARDARILIDGGYSLGAATPFDLFPQTRHIESAITFDLIPREFEA